MKVRDLMTRDVGCCRLGENLSQAVAVMSERDVGTVPILDDEERVVGILTDRDVCLAAFRKGRALESIPLAEVMTTQVHTCRANDDLGVAEDVMESKRVRRLPVLDGEEKIAGVISLHDIAREAAREATVGDIIRKVEHAEVGQVLAGICASRPLAASAAQSATDFTPESVK